MNSYVIRNFSNRVSLKMRDVTFRFETTSFNSEKLHLHEKTFVEPLHVALGARRSEAAAAGMPPFNLQAKGCYENGINLRIVRDREAAIG